MQADGRNDITAAALRENAACLHPQEWKGGSYIPYTPNMHLK